MDYPKITIITPSYNQGRYIDQTIQSVLNQAYPNLEYFVIDGGSEDNSKEIIEKYSDKIQWWISEKDNGPSEAINKGLSRAQGNIITWLNSDDYYEPKILYHVADVFDRNSSTLCYIGKIKFHNLDGSTSYSSNIVYETFEKTAGFGRINQPAMFFSRKAIEKMGLLNQNLQFCFDLEWWLKYLLVFRCNNIISDNKLLVNFRHHFESKTIAKSTYFSKEKDSIYYSLATQNELIEEANVIKKYGDIIPEYSFHHSAKYTKELIKKIIHYFLLLRGNEYYVDLDKDAALDFFKTIDSALLLPADKELMDKIKFRSKYIPDSIIKLLRK